MPTSTPPTPTPAPRGRLTPERELEIYTAVLNRLSENGYEGLRLDQVAEDAHCSKATLYRLWEGKRDLVVSALSCGAAEPDVITQPKPQSPVPDTGSLRGDLRAWADEFVHHHAADIALILGLARTCLAHPDLARAAHQRVMANESGRFRAMLERAAARGEIDAGRPAQGFVVHALAGPALLHDILTGGPVTTASLYTYIDALVLPALGAQPTN